MKLLSSTGREDLSIVHIAETAGGNLIEFVESLHPPKPREEKWILVVSTLYGCPVNCTICDAGPYYLGRISKEGIFWQIDTMITKYYPDGKVPVKQLKIQFARMGEPAFNRNVLEVINEFGYYFDAPGFMPSISSIAPAGSDKFFEDLLSIKREKFSNGNFQLQFSIHTTDEERRNELIPVKKWSFAKIAEYGKRFYTKGDRKITLSFAVSHDYPIEPEKLHEIFDPSVFLVKLTPLNPTYKAGKTGIISLPQNDAIEKLPSLAGEFKDAGYDTVISIGEPEENLIGSNCGQNLLVEALEEKQSDIRYSAGLSEEIRSKVTGQLKKP
jgi:23S rRNA (adenine2503-C2)-methyltransferase